MALAVRKSSQEDKIRNRMRVVVEYEEAVVRLGDKGKDHWVSIVQDRLQQQKDRLELRKAKLLQVEYETIARSFHTQRLHKKPQILEISITDLAQIAYAETKAWEDTIGPTLTLRQLQAESKRIEGELHEKEQEREQMQTGSNNSMEVAEGDSETQKLKTSIEEYSNMIQKYETQLTLLFREAFMAMTRVNRAARSIIEIPGVGQYAPIPAPVTITTAQVKVTDIPSDVKAAAAAAAKEIQLRTTAIVKVDKKLSSGITLCSPLEQYADVKRIEQHEFDIGDIGWFPILRPSLSAHESDIHTQFGYVCAKSYPLIIVRKLDDCMLGLIISTANGNGLRLKGSSVKNRSVPIVPKLFSNYGSTDWGHDLYPRAMLRVQDSSDYRPPVGAHVDMLNTIMIPYDSRFQKRGKLVLEDVVLLQQMRLSAVLTTSKPEEPGTLVGFCKWIWNWACKFDVSETLMKVVMDVAISRRRLLIEEAQSKAQTAAQKQVEVQEEAQREVKAEALLDEKPE